MTRQVGRSSSAIYAWPLLLGALTLFALAAALLADTVVWRWAAWSALAAPLAVIACCGALGWRRARQGIPTETASPAP